MNNGYYNDLENDTMEMKVSVSFINDNLKYLKEKRLVDMFINTNTKDSYICDCGRNYGKTCKYPDKYRNGGCK